MDDAFVFYGDRYYFSDLRICERQVRDVLAGRIPVRLFLCFAPGIKEVNNRAFCFRKSDWRSDPVPASERS